MASNPKQKTIPTVYNLSSSKAQESLWALEELADAGIEYRVVNLSRQDWDSYKVLKSRFPLGKSPTVTLEHVDENREVIYQIHPNVITETRLILQFFSDHYANGAWDPKSEEDKRRNAYFQEFANNTLQAKVDAIVLFEAIPSILFFPFRQLTMLMVLPIRNHIMKDLAIIYQILEDALSAERPWFAGKELGLADFNIIFPLGIAVAKGIVPGETYPKLLAWHHRVVNRPAFKRALSKAGKYDLKTFAKLTERSLSGLNQKYNIYVLDEQQTTKPY